MDIDIVDLKDCVTSWRQVTVLRVYKLKAILRSQFPSWLIKVNNIINSCSVDITNIWKPFCMNAGL